MSIPLETVLNNMQTRAETCSKATAIAYAVRHPDRKAYRAMAEEAWESWVYLKGLTRLIGQVQGLGAMVREGQ